MRTPRKRKLQLATEVCNDPLDLLETDPALNGTFSRELGDHFFNTLDLTIPTNHIYYTIWAKMRRELILSPKHYEDQQ